MFPHQKRFLIPFCLVVGHRCDSRRDSKAVARSSPAFQSVYLEFAALDVHDSQGSMAPPSSAALPSFLDPNALDPVNLTHILPDMV
jgi:hypothetical protein